MSRPLFYLLALVWLPVGVVASALFRFGVAGSLREWLLPLTAGPAGLPLAERIAIAASVWLPLLTVAPAGLPLALACRRLHRKGYRVIAWAAMAVLSVVTVVATLVAGLLGPAAIVIYALALSLPVWLAALLLPRREP